VLDLFPGLPPLRPSHFAALRLVILFLKPLVLFVFVRGEVFLFWGSDHGSFLHLLFLSDWESGMWAVWVCLEESTLTAFVGGSDLLAVSGREVERVFLFADQASPTGFLKEQHEYMSYFDFGLQTS
jgi:hypothetical protein